MINAIWAEYELRHALDAAQRALRHPAPARQRAPKPARPKDVARGYDRRFDPDRVLARLLGGDVR